MKYKFLLLLAALFSSPLMAAHYTVTVNAITGGGGVTYHYTVTNNHPANVVEQTSITSFTIGRALKDADGDRAGQIKNVGAAFSGATPVSPPGWIGSFGRYAERENHWVAWQIAGPRGPGIRLDTSIASIKPGQTLPGFSVFSTVPDDAYLNGNWYIVADRGVSEQGSFVRTDTLPPALSVTLTPNTLKSNDKMVAIAATITATDNYDPLPAIVLESITVSQTPDVGDIKNAAVGTDDRAFNLKADFDGKAGRVYTVTYSATDGSGNKSTASATVTVR